MGKFKATAIVTVVVVVAYIFLLVAMPVITDAASTANTTMSASSNMSNYPGTQEGVLAAPWALFFVPGAIGMVFIVIILRSP